MSPHGVTISVAYPIGTLVFLRAADVATAGIVCGYVVRDNKLVSYLVSWPDEGEHQHYAFELSREHVPDYARDQS